MSLAIKESKTFHELKFNGKDRQSDDVLRLATMAMDLECRTSNDSREKLFLTVQKMHNRIKEIEAELKAFKRRDTAMSLANIMTNNNLKQSESKS